MQTDKDAFKYGLFRAGYLVVFETKRYGITFQYGTPYGFGLQYQPTGMTVTTPFFDFGRPLEIGRECEVLKLTPDYAGIWDIVNKYSYELMCQEVAIRQSQLNARFAYVAWAETDKDSKTAKALFERLANGEPGLVVDAKRRQLMPDGEPRAPWEQFDRDLKQNFILPELLEGRRTIITDFYREMGVPVPIDKKERTNVEETRTNNAEVFNRRDVWKTCLDETAERVNRMYGTDITFEFSDEGALAEMGVAKDVSDSTGQSSKQPT